MVRHKEFVQIRWSQFQRGVWYRIVITDVECREITIPMVGTFLAYKAYFLNDYIPKDKQFEVIFPLNEFKYQYNKNPETWRQEVKDNRRQIQFEFAKIRGHLITKNWECV